MSEAPTLTVNTFDDAKEIYRQKSLRQALYDAGEIVMSGVLVNLHGDEHRSRRRLENRLFRRETLVSYERDFFPSIIDATLKPYVAQGSAELVHMSHQLMMNLAAHNAGVDRPTGTPEETDRLYSYMMKFIEGATLAHTTRDPEVVKGEVTESMSLFDAEFIAPSVERRQALIAAVAAGDAPESSLPLDILTVLLRNEDALHIEHHTLVREIAFFLLAGAHTSATAFVRTLDNLFTWLEKHPEDSELVHTNREFVQHAVYETIRLNPSSPIAMRRALEDVTLRSGLVIKEGSTVVIDLMAVNRDVAMYGADAAEFNPHRQPADSTVSRWGLSFGSGMHACIGQELAAGLNERSQETADYEYGLSTVAVQSMFDRGVRPDPANPPQMDTATSRPYWGSYSVLLG
jgi:cytochrome P450